MANIIGLQSGMVLQRDNSNQCVAYFYVDVPGEVTVSIGTAAEMEGGEGERKYKLTGIFTGGPYALTVTVGEESFTYTDIYVGDVWVLAGQSNMDGAGHTHFVAGDYTPNAQIRSYTTDGYWEVAAHDLHKNYRSKDAFIHNYLGEANVKAEWQVWQNRPVGPGYPMAKEMFRRTGVPQGLIPCALGGSGLCHWTPDAPKDADPNLYGIMIRKYKECGGNARGMFWYQGCSETGPGAADVFTQNMIHLVESARRDMDRPDLAFVQVQLFEYVCCDMAADPVWNSIREQQRTLAEKIPNMDTVATTNAVKADGIHLEGCYHEILGKNAACSMFRLCFDPYEVQSVLAPQLDTITTVSFPNEWIGSVLAVKYKNLIGSLTSEGRPTGFAISTKPDSIDMRHIFRVDLFRDTAYIRHEIPYEKLKESYLFYFYGCGTYANITDSEGRPIPGMGPIKLSDYLK